MFSSTFKKIKNFLNIFRIANSSTNNHSSQQILIGVKEAYKKFHDKEAVFLDIRDPSEFQKSHIPGARNVNEIFTFLSTSDKVGQEEMKTKFQEIFRREGITGNEKIIAYEECLRSRFGASCRAFYILSLLGHPDVQVLHGGWESWLNEGYPVSDKIENIPVGTFQANWNDQIFGDKIEVLNAIKDPNTILLDVRDLDEWVGESSSPYGKDFTPRKGRIPGAVHLFWRDLMTVENNVTFIKKPQEITEICEKKGITKDKNIIIYCFKGARASNTFIALKSAGFEKVKNYFASWNEWSRDKNLPIDDSKI
jgi:thiosulfate/3-mercaptopyruvate sulfurtransferase